MRFGSPNPVFRNINMDDSYDTDSASYLGVTTKTTILLGIIAVVAMYTVSTLTIESLSSMLITMIGALIFSMIMVLVSHRMPHIAFITAPLYAVCEGYILGILSAMYSYAFGGEIIEYALIGTFSVTGAMLFLYSTGVIRVGSFFRRMMRSVILGLLFAHLVMFIASLFGVNVYQNYGLYTALSLVGVIAASLYLLIDFDRITRYVESGISRNAEWSLGLGLVTTLVWLYVELLRIIAIFTSRD
jgi:uncharacterized YccA/Bax inhibitor family protein